MHAQKHSATFTIDGVRVRIDLDISVQSGHAARWTDGALVKNPVRISFTGVSSTFGAGQIAESIRAHLDRSEATLEEKFSVYAVLDAWDEYHLNDMRAGSARQTAALATLKGPRTYDACKAHLATVGLDPDAGLLDGYAYGSRWLHEPVDESDIMPAIAALAELDGQDLGIMPDLDEAPDLDGDTFSTEDVIKARDIYKAYCVASGYGAAADVPDSAENAAELRAAFERLAALKEFCETGEAYCPDWEHGETIIAESHFEEWAKNYADDCGMIDPKLTWPNNHIDWKAAARELRQDYTEFEFEGVTYLFR